jgi:hypothetical protein
MDLERVLFEAGERFWVDNVIGRKAPVITDSASVRQYLDAKYPPLPVPRLVDGDPALSDILVRRELASETVKKAKSSYDKSTHEAIQWMGEHAADVAMGPAEGWRFAYKVNKNGDRRPLFTRKKGAQAREGEDDE